MSVYICVCVCVKEREAEQIKAVNKELNSYFGTGGFLLKFTIELAGFVVQRIVRLILLFFQSQSSWSQTVVIIGLREMPSRETGSSVSLMSSSLSSLPAALPWRRLTSVSRLEGNLYIPIKF